MSLDMKRWDMVMIELQVPRSLVFPCLFVASPNISNVTPSLLFLLLHFC